MTRWTRPIHWPGRPLKNMLTGYCDSLQSLSPDVGMDIGTHQECKDEQQHICRSPAVWHPNSLILPGAPPKSNSPRLKSSRASSAHSPKDCPLSQRPPVPLTIADFNAGTRMAVTWRCVPGAHQPIPARPLTAKKALALPWPGGPGAERLTMTNKTTR